MARAAAEAKDEVEAETEALWDGVALEVGVLADLAVVWCQNARDAED